MVDFDRHSPPRRPLRTRCSTRLAVSLVAMGLVSCSTSISAVGYDQKCTENADCVVVAQGPLCNTCSVCAETFGAISKSAADRYTKDAASIRANCPPRLGPPPPCAPPQANPCPTPPSARCVAGVCEATGSP